MSVILNRLRETVTNQSKHPVFNVTSRPPTKEEIVQAPPQHPFSRKQSKEKILLDNRDLFQMGVSFNVEYDPYPHGDSDNESN